MKINDIENELNNPTFKIDFSKFLLSIQTTNLMNSYHLKEILKRQIEILELQKGKTGQELESSVESELENLNKTFTVWLNEDLIDVVNDSSPD